ncbi:unnamed protein product [Calypogeia fissa]
MSSSLSYTSQLIPKFEGGNNFKTWKHLCRSGIESSGVWHHVDGSAVAPTKETDEKDYIFQERLRLFRAQAATARTIIVGSCAPSIQETLEQLRMAKECWDRLIASFSADGLLYVYDVYTAFHSLTHNGERMDDFCNTYLTAIERCVALNVEIQDKVRVIRFISCMEKHFDQWAFSQRQHLRTNPTQLPSLETLMQQVRDEYRRRMEQTDAQFQALYPTLPSTTTTLLSSSNSTREAPRHVCSYCTLPRHKDDRCFYKHPHLRRPGWKPVAAILKKIQECQSIQPSLQTSVVPPPREESRSHFDSEFVSGHFLTADATSFIESNVAASQSLWIADSGATHHFCNNRDFLVDYQESPLNINTGNGTTISPGFGTVHLSVLRSDSQFHPISLAQVRFMPSCRVNTISERVLEQRGIFYRGEHQKFFHLATGQEFAQINIASGLRAFTIQIHSSIGAQCHAVIPPTLVNDINLLHQRLAHLHEDGIRKLLKQEDLTLSHSSPLLPCEACAMAKSTRIICRIPHTRAVAPFQKIHVDLCGKMTTSGIGDKNYYLLFIDDFSRFRWVTCLTNKLQVFPTLKTFFKAMETQFRCHIAELHIDNGTEFGCTHLEQFLAEVGCKLVQTAPYHHEENGISERSIGVISQKARAMILGAKLPVQLWPEAIHMAVFLTNNSPSSVNPGESSPAKLLHSALQLPYAFNLRHLKAYGAVAYVHIVPEKRKQGEKFVARARKGYLVGYAEGLHYRVWFPHTNEVIRSSYVQFDETLRQTAIPYVFVPVSSPSIHQLDEYVNVLLPPMDFLSELASTTSHHVPVPSPSTTVVFQPSTPMPSPSSSVSMPLELPFIPPPLGTPPPDELVADIQAAP